MYAEHHPDPRASDAATPAHAYATIAAYERVGWLAGKKTPIKLFFACLRELPDPGWRVEIGVGGQGSGGARPRKRPQGLDGDAVRRTLFRTGESKRLVLLSACGTGGSVPSSGPVSRCGAGDG